MKQEKETFIELLKDFEIRKIIRRIAKESDVDLERQLSQAEQENHRLKEAMKQQTHRIAQIEQENATLSKTIEFYRSRFEEELRAYEMFMALSTETKESIKGIFRDHSLAGFIVCGVQESNLASLWDYISVELREYRNGDIENLKQIFYFLFARYTLANPHLALQEVHTNDSFDTQTHTIHHQSTARSGVIKEVVLRGWTNTATHKIIKKSIIKL